MPAYAELQVTTNFTFLQGASHAEELVRRAHALGLAALAVTDRNTLAGVVRAHAAAREVGLRLIVGARLDLADGPSRLCLPTDRAAYGRLSRLLTLGKRRAEKGACHLLEADVAAHAEGQVFVVLPPAPDPETGALPPVTPPAGFATALEALARRYPGQVDLGVSMLFRGDDRARLAALGALGDRAGVPLVALNDVRYHRADRRMLADVLTCIRAHETIDRAGFRLAANAERHLKAPDEMARLFADRPEAVARSVAIAERCRFSLDELRYEYPDETTEAGRTPQEELAHRTAIGLAERYPEGVPAKVRAQVDHELRLIATLGYAPYFLTVYDLVRFARSRGILCQGRGSAANSAVCYALGVTAVDPARVDLLFERFVSAERGEPPDIDIDFEHERREEVIQYVYAKYGRDRAGLAATVISYRPRSAVREVGKAMGLSEDLVGRLAGTVWGWHGDGVGEDHIREIGLDPDEPRLAATLRLTRALIGFPRHLSQHVGGFVITRGKLSDVVPIENAAMADRTVIEWDKDDLDAVGLLKVDVLALGMLSCVRRAFDLIERHYGARYSLATVPSEEKAVYDMLCRADSLGVFQVESRAQMSFLPRMKPRNFYDLVIEVAIVRPGPIQGDMVHPYLRRRNGLERVEYPSEDLRRVLDKTLGVPLFQEQAMKMAIVAAGFTPDEADGLRRAMATFRRNGEIERFAARFVEGMVDRDYDRGFAERCFRQIEGFSTYGFPESHAASFALLVYVSAWIKCRYPDVFACALLNSQPMGFYAPAQIVRDAREHGVEVRPASVLHSGWDHALEPAEPGGGSPHALRLGLRQVKGVSEEEIGRLVAARAGLGSAPGAVTGVAAVEALWREGPVAPATLERLAAADAMTDLGLDRRGALWAVGRLGERELPLFAAARSRAAARPPEPQPAHRDPAHREPTHREPDVELAPMALGESIVEDYQALRLSLRAHPLALLRRDLGRLGIRPAEVLRHAGAGRGLCVAGLVTVRQRPGSARGVIFLTLEDETAIANVIVRPPVFEQARAAVMRARLLEVRGHVEREATVVHLLAARLVDRSGLLDRLTDAVDLPETLARADEVKRPIPPSRLPPDRPRLAVSSRNFH